MSAEAVMSEIIEPMQRLFLPPRAMPEAQVSQALREYIDALQDFPTEDLKAAWRSARETNTTRSWPAISMFVLAARKSRKDRGAAPTLRESRPSVTDHRLAWERARSDPKAHEAANLGVAWSLKCAMLNDGKPLAAIDLRALRIGKNSAERTAEAIERCDPIEYKGRILKFEDGPNRDVALDMWRKVQRNEDDTAAEIRRHQPRRAAA